MAYTLKKIIGFILLLVTVGGVSALSVLQLFPSL